MTKKIVVRVCMNDEKSRSKALKISVGVSGVEKASVKCDQLEVEGECIDAVKLTEKLRKRMGHADLLSVGEVKPENPAPPAKPEAPEPRPAVVWASAPLRCNEYVNYPVYEVMVPSCEPGCAIL